MLLMDSIHYGDLCAEKTNIHVYVLTQIRAYCFEPVPYLRDAALLNDREFERLVTRMQTGQNN